MYSTRFKRFFEEKKAWPPVISQCPDYWVTDDHNQCVRSHKCDPNVSKGIKKCINRGDVRPECGSFPTFKETLPESSKKAIRKRATDCNVFWNGVSERV